MLGKRKADVNFRVALVLIFDFRLGQCRTAIKTPVDRLQAAIDVTFFNQLSECADFVGLVAVIHRQVRVVPLAQHAQTDEVLFLALHLLGRIRARLALHFGHRQMLAELLFNLNLDRHAVAIPARHVMRVKAGHVAALDNDVFQNLVHRMADVDIAVRIRRAVMQGEHRATLCGLANALVNFLLLPLRDPLRFTL